MDLSRPAQEWAGEQWRLGRIDSEYKHEGITIAAWAYEEGIKAGLAMRDTGTEPRPSSVE